MPPVSKKTIENKKYKKWTPTAIMALRSEWKGKAPIDIPIHAKFTFYYTGNRTDLSNAYEAVQDWLQVVNGKKAGAGIITDDRLIESHEGSRMIYVCTGCEWYNPDTEKRLKSTTKLSRCPGQRNCGLAQPRTIIELRKFKQE